MNTTPGYEALHVGWVLSESDTQEISSEEMRELILAQGDVPDFGDGEPVEDVLTREALTPSSPT